MARPPAGGLLAVLLGLPDLTPCESPGILPSPLPAPPSTPSETSFQICPQPRGQPLVLLSFQGCAPPDFSGRGAQKR